MAFSLSHTCVSTLNNLDSTVSLILSMEPIQAIVIDFDDKNMFLMAFLICPHHIFSLFHHGALITMLKAICLGINQRGVSKLQRAGSKAIATGATSRALLSTATQLLLLHHHQCCYTIQH